MTRLKPLVVCMVIGIMVAAMGPSALASKRPTAMTYGPALAQLKTEIAASATATARPNLKATLPAVTDTHWYEAQPFPTKAWCDLTTSPTLPSNPATACSLGDAKATRTILLWGDSHAAMFAPALDIVGQLLQWHVVWLAMNSCPPWLDPNLVDASGNSTAACHTFRKNVVAYANKTHPAVILPVGVAGTYGRGKYPTTAQLTTEIEALVTTLKPSHSKVVLIGHTPDYQPVIPDQCLVVASNPTKCEKSPTATNTNSLGPALAAAARADVLADVDVISLFCTSTACPLFVKAPDFTRLVYLDSSHVFRYYMAWIGPALSTLLKPAL